MRKLVVKIDHKKNATIDEWKKEKTRKYENQLSAMKCFKTSLKRIVKNESTIIIIEDAVQRTNKIVIHTYQFLKMYCSYQFNPMPSTLF